MTWKNLAGLVGVGFALLSSLVKVVQWTGELEKRVTLLEWEHRYYHGDTLASGGETQ